MRYAAIKLSGSLSGVILAMLPAIVHANCADPFKIAVERGAKAFTQTRHLNKVATPLISQGEAVIAPDRVEWHVTKPLDVLTTITPRGITQSVENSPPQSVGPEDASNSFLTSTGLFDLLVGDFATARTHYDIVNIPTQQTKSWKLNFTPRQPALAQFISNIVVEGCTGIEQVEVHQANGDWMQITLAAGRRGD
jgi:hypothetical protein